MNGVAKGHMMFSFAKTRKEEESKEKEGWIQGSCNGARPAINAVKAEGRLLNFKRGGLLWGEERTIGKRGGGKIDISHTLYSAQTFQVLMPWRAEGGGS